jgi:hypothetical protein
MENLKVYFILPLSQSEVCKFYQVMELIFVILPRFSVHTLARYQLHAQLTYY